MPRSYLVLHFLFTEARMRKTRFWMESSALNKIIMQYISIVIQLLPLAIFSFVAQAVGVLGNQLFKALGLLVTADFVGMICMTVIFGTLTAAFLRRKSDETLRQTWSDSDSCCRICFLGGCSADQRLKIRRRNLVYLPELQSLFVPWV